MYTAAYRNLKWSLLGFVVGLVGMVLALGTHYLLSFAGFVVMLISALAAERNARRLGKVGMQQMTQSMKTAGLRDALGNTSTRLKDRMKRDETE